MYFQNICVSSFCTTHHEQMKTDPSSLVHKVRQRQLALTSKLACCQALISLISSAAERFMIWSLCRSWLASSMLDQTNKECTVM